MTSIKIWDTDYERIEQTAEANNMDIADVVELLVDHMEEIKRENGLI